MSSLPDHIEEAVTAPRRRIPRRRCVYCSLLLAPALRRHLIEGLDQEMLILLGSWTHYEELFRDDVLCAECFISLQDRISNQTQSQADDVAPAFGHKHVCFGCGISILRCRTYKVPLNCPERSVILKSTPKHQVSLLEKVCMACWMAARREVRRPPQQDVKPPVDEMVPPIPDNVEGQLADSGVPLVPEPPSLPQAQPQQPLRRKKQIINSSKYKRVATTIRHCLFTGCKNVPKYLVPMSIKETLLFEHKIYVPLNIRICLHHLKRNSWNELDAPYTDFTALQVDDIFSKLERAAERSLDFNNVNNMDQHLCQYWLGLNASQFNELLTLVPSLNKSVKKPRLALSILLVKLRTGDSNQKLATLFNLPRSTFERYMNKAKNCLTEELASTFLDTNISLSNM